MLAGFSVKTPGWVALLLPILLVPLVPKPELTPLEASPELQDRHGRVLASRTSEDHYRHLPAEEFPQSLIDATLVTEDQRFFDHGGIDYLALARALKDNVQEQRTVSGASTVTQQLVKISSPRTQRGLWVKAREAWQARRLEVHWSKEKILHEYLNRLDYGNRSRGVQAAAWHYFNKPLFDLSLAESALLAGLPQAPSRLNPRRNLALAKARRNWILDRLGEKRGYLPKCIAQAKAEPIRLAEFSPVNLIPHLGGTSGPQVLTIDGELQRKTGKILRKELARLADKRVQHGALVVIENKTGEILVWHGSPDFETAQIDGVTTPRSPGSVLKPFTYLLAMREQGLTPSSIIADVPSQFELDGAVATPQNFDRRFRGPVSMRRALANSLNIPPMRLLDELGGPQPLHRMLTQLGMKSLPPADTCGLGITIGNGEVTLLELTRAYSTLARGGWDIEPSLRFGRRQPVRLLDEGRCYLISDVLSDNAARVQTFGVHSSLRLPFRCAVKTGTSSDFRDNWCVGYTADFTVGVWMGNFDHSPTAGVTGASGAGSVFHRTMLALHRESVPSFPERPVSVVEVRVDPQTGKRVDQGGVSEVALVGALPVDSCSDDYRDGKVVLGPSYLEWLREHSEARKCYWIPDEAMPKPQILSPIPNGSYLIDPDLPQAASRLALKANRMGRWSSPTLELEGEMAILREGRHRIVFETGDEVLVREIEVEGL